MTLLRRPALKAIRSGFRVLLGHLWATRNEPVQEDRLPIVAGLYAVHAVSWTALQVLDGCYRVLTVIAPDRHWTPPDGSYSFAETACAACKGSGVCRYFGDDWCGSCGGPGVAWLNPAELAREMRR